MAAWSRSLIWLMGHVVPGRKIAAVKRVLLTGMSGTGKSSVIRALSACGFKAVDTDDGWCEPLPDGRQRWREDAISQMLDTEDAGVLFVAGCEENRVRFHPRFDLIILLRARWPGGTLYSWTMESSAAYGGALCG
jgi:hypothetical protein